MANNKQKIRGAVGIILALVVAGVLIGYILPIGIGAVNEPIQSTQTQDIGETYNVSSNLDSEVTSVTDGTSATVALTDTEAGETQSQTVNVSENGTYNLPGGDVTVTVNNATSGTPSTAELTYQVPSDFGWSSGAQSVYGLIPLFLILAPLVVIVGWSMDAF